MDFEYIGPYRIVRVLGQGGMGTVYHGVHSKTNEPVAVKVISPALAQHLRFRRRFDAEIQTLLKLKHSNIVQLIGSGEERGMLFYSMEYVDGENLQQQLRREGKFPWQRVIDIGVEVSSALKHAHDFGIIHRDLKPANLMINPQGHVKLTDFGIAKLFGAADATVEGSILGTADFMSPEQAEGKPVTVRSDLYALGSVCYAALTGRAPFQGKNVPEVLFNVRYSPLVPISELVKDIPKELSDLIEELLSKDPSRRPPTGLVVGNRFQSLKMGLVNRVTDTGSTKDVSRLKELTSIDIDPDLIAQSRVIGDGTSHGGDHTELRVWPSNPPASKGTPAAKTQPGFPSRAGPDDNTIPQLSLSPVVSVESIDGDRPSGIDHMGKTNFKEFEDKDRRQTSLAPSQPQEPNASAQWIAVGLLSLLLIGCVGAIIWLLLPPSADSLYAEVSNAIMANDEDVWLDVEPFAETFRKLYPNDPRIADVEATLAEIEAIRAMRQLQRKARRGAADQLTAIEQAYLECVAADSLDSQTAIKKLQAFLVVFGGDEESSKTSKQLVNQARRSLERLNASQNTKKNEALDWLKKQMDWAEANLSQSLRKRWLASVVELFQDKPWARELVERARNDLKEAEIK